MNQDKRYNVFNQIHKTLRRLLFDTAILIQQTDFAGDDALLSIGQVEAVLLQFEEHAAHEDTIILPRLRAYEPAITETFEAEHHTDYRLGEELRSLIGKWRAADHPEARNRAGLRLQFSFNEFVAFNLYHMNKEENVLLQALWKHYSDEQILALQHEVLQAVSPAMAEALQPLMFRALNNPEIAGWLRAIQAQAPPPAFDALLQIARRELPAERMSALEAVLAA